MDKLINGEATNVTDLSKQLGLKSGYVTRILSLNSLAPDIVAEREHLFYDVYLKNARQIDSTIHSESADFNRSAKNGGE